MGRYKLLWFLAILSSWCSHAWSSPRVENTFARSSVEAIPPHDDIAAPIRASVESIPLRSLREENEGRLPLRDAVEKRPEFTDHQPIIKSSQDFENQRTDDVIGHLKNYYGAANYLNKNKGHKNDERLQQGNANLQEMQQTAGAPAQRRSVVCYMQSWAAYRAPPLAFTAGLVPKACTHLHYAFAAIHPHTYAITPANEDYDVIKGGYRIATGLKRSMQGLRVLISVGGDGTDRLFSEMVAEPMRRRVFVDSAVAFLRDHDFDGLDLHWTYPGENDEGEKEKLTALLYELREKFSGYGFLLSTVLPPLRYQIEDGYDMAAVSGATDYAVLQAWDMTHSAPEQPPRRALQHSALYRDPGAGSRDRRYDNIDFMVKYILRHGMAADKLVLGVPFFGRSYTLAASTLPAPGAPVSSWGDEGQYTQTKGVLAYFEICMAEREGRGSSGTDEAGNAYAIFDKQWVSYDTVTTLAEKMKYVVNSGLAGAAAWAIDMDDFRGLCGSSFPLLNTLASALNGNSVSSDQSTLKIGACESTAAYLASDEESCAYYHFCSGGINYRIACEDDRLYDPATGFCGHLDPSKCLPGQSLRISVSDAARFLTQAYESDFEWSNDAQKNGMYSQEPVRLVESATPRKDANSDKRIVCYMTSWAFYRRGDGKFVPEHVDTRLCTHVVYAYASLSPDDLIAKEFDPWTDINNNLYERVTSLKDVKVLLGLGGWTDSAGDKYSRLVSSSKNRAKFIEKLIPFLRTHNFQGLHLDWNYPVCWQSNCKKGALSDKANFAKFVQELGSALHGLDMELGVALSGYKEVIESAYDLPKLSRAADFLSTMTYDYHGGWERKTGHHTPLVPPTTDNLPFYSIEHAIKSLISGGAEPKKLLLGLSFYGQSFRLADVEASSGQGAPAAGPGEPGEFTKQPGMLAYYEICYRVKNLRWTVGHQNKAGPYAYADNQWVGYDDPKSITEKVKWAMSQGLGGVTAWAIDLDDFNNRCCAEASPLLRAAGRALGRSVPAPPHSACERPPQPVTPAPPTTTTAASDGSIGGGDHGSHGGHDHTSTTWPSWNPSTTTPATTQTWWQPATTTVATTPSTTTTTTKRPTTSTTVKTTSDSGFEGSSCVAGDYKAAPGDCDSYLQCVGGQWRKNRCAPGLHWHSKAKRCDWPSFAKCTDTSSGTEESSAATSTLAPMTSRPPIPTTSKRTTTTSTTTTTTTTTVKPTTSASPIHSPGSPSEGEFCNGHDYEAVAGDCNSYLHCDGSTWIQQQCAPGLHWSASERHCDWPKHANCIAEVSKPSAAPPRPTRPVARPTRPPSHTTSTPNKATEGSSCKTGDTHAPSDSCGSYLQCVGDSWRKELCPPGLHWDKRTNRCDWAEFAMCDLKATTQKQTTKRPSYTQNTEAPVESLSPGMRCQTGTYHTHPRCDKFYVCVNNVLVAQSCAPGLVWRPERSQCDFPRSTSCSDQRQVTSSAAIMDIMQPEPSAPTIMHLTACENGEYSSYPGDCGRYRHCLFGEFKEFSCSSGLHWNKDKQICDWPANARCTESSEVPEHVESVGVPSSPEHPSHDPVPAPSPTVPPIIRPITEVPTTITLPAVEAKPDLTNSRYKLVCYYTNWSWYRPGIGKYVPEDIDPSMCTHVVYGFAVLSYDGVITAHDSWADFDNRFYERVVAYKKHGIKVSLAIGGWNDSAGDKYSKLVNNPAAREKFVRHVVQFLEKYGFDGLDLDWEYPKCWQVDCSKGPDSDKDGFSALVKELSAVFKPRGYLLSSAVSPNKKVIDAGYDVPILAQHMDWIAVMTYDYHGQWDKKTGHVAPLYHHPDDDTTYFNANYTMRYWMEKGAPPSKLVMGIPLYGQSFTMGTQWDTPPELLARKNQTGLNVPARSGGEAGEFTRAKGFLAYYEICERLRNRGWQVVKDPLGRMGPYAFKGDQWVSFDDVEIIKKKVNFIKSLNLAGGMVWALDLDDFRNRCGQGKHPLLNTIKNGLLEPHTNDINAQTELIKQPPKEESYDIEVTPAYPKKPDTTQAVQTTQKYSDTEVETTKIPHHDVSNHLDGHEDEFKVVCYYTNWAWYRPGPGKYAPGDIDPSLCTHIVYAFAVLDSNRLVIKPHDSWADIDNKFYEKVVALKSKGIKVLLGLGGWNDSAGSKYSRLVNSAAARRTFVVHALDFIEQYGFDGLDLDWEYPKCWQVECNKGPDSDKQGFADLVRELRVVFTPRGYLLSAAVSPSKRVIDAGYDVPVLSENLDWIAVMTYDYHGQWDKKTGHVAPMYVRDDDDDKTFNANFTIHYWIEKGAARRKLVMGVPLYGQSFSLAESSGTGLGMPTYGGGEAGDETRARGFLAFYEICERIRIRNWRVARDPGGRMGPYAIKGDQWVSFDDDFMVRHKAEYVRAMGLGGGMVWALDLDDFTGRFCGCGKSPLLSNINHVLRGRKAPPPCPLEDVSSEVATTSPVHVHEPVVTTSSVPLDDPPRYQVGDNESDNELSLEHSECSGNTFKADSRDCNKYYLCNNGHYMQLSCPKPLHWNENHCDWPSKSHCKNTAQMRIAPGVEQFQPMVVCYFTNWAFYRHGHGKYSPEQVDGSLCTHIVYAWAHLDAETNELVPGNPELDVQNDFFGKITELRLKGVKVVLGAGGLQDSETDKWSSMAANKNSRKSFVQSALKLLKRWNFDGLQLAWQYPVCKQAPCSTSQYLSDKDNFSSLLLDLSKSLRAAGLELSVAVSPSAKISAIAYDERVLAATVDWLVVAANDYHTSSTGHTAHIAPLVSQDAAVTNSLNDSLGFWLDALPPHLVVVGLPAYGRSYSLRSSDDKRPGAPATGPGSPGPYTAVSGFLAYYEICENIAFKEWQAAETLQGSYAVKDFQWTSYLSPWDVHRATSLAVRQGARGAALYSLDLDDYRNVCRCGSHPLLKAMRQALFDPDLPLSRCL